MTTQAPPRFVDAVIEEDGRALCPCGRFLLELHDPALLAILQTYRIKFYAPSCKRCGSRPVIDFAEVQLRA